jgi:hypothetical protein
LSRFSRIWVYVADQARARLTQQTRQQPITDIGLVRLVKKLAGFG